MLSRTADNLYWLARYMERADFLARIVEASLRVSALPDNDASDGAEWQGALRSSGVEEAFAATGLVADEASVVFFLTFSLDNPSSIRNCVDLARNNARCVRTALTVEMWETINAAWLEMRQFETAQNADGLHDRERVGRFLDFLKRTSLAFDGSAYRTMLRNDAYWFARVGLYIERADNTARLLDVKYHVLLPENESVGGSLDYSQWTAVLRAVSALTAYHWVYRESVKPWLIADLLILKVEMPRSLISCYENLVRNLDHLAETHGEEGPAQREAREARAKLEGASIKTIFQSGLHEFIAAFVEGNNRLGQTISEQYMLS